MDMAKELGKIDGRALKAMREASNITIDELCDAIGVEEHQLRGVEKGWRQFSPRQTMKLVALVGKDGMLHLPEGESNGANDTGETSGAVEGAGGDVRALLETGADNVPEVADVRHGLENL